MNLTSEEKKLLIAAKDEAAWYSICDDIKARRNGIYPNYLSREVLDIYQNKFAIEKYKTLYVKYTRGLANTTNGDGVFCIFICSGKNQ